MAELADHVRALAPDPGPRLTMFNFAFASPLEVGDLAPDVSALTDEGVELSLHQVYGDNDYTLVYFYPKADTPGCTRQGCSLRDAYADLTAQGVAVIGASYDRVEQQRAFKERHHLPFTLLADTDQRVAQAFGAKGLVLARRSAFLVHQGKIVYADHHGSTSRQSADILGFLRG